MKKIFLIGVFVTFFVSWGFSQSRIVVQNEQQTQVFNHFDDALGAAEEGAIIYLPGGAINIGITYIEKELTIYGAGHHPEYTEATGITMLNGTIYMRQADPEIPLENIHLEGFYISGDIRIGTTTDNQNVNQVNIKRCSMNDLYLSLTASTTGEAEQIHVIESIIRGRVYGGGAQNVLFSKNIIEKSFWYFDGNALFTNNIFLDGSNSTVYTSFRHIENSTFRNNVILCISSSNCFRDMSANNFYNNLWHHDFSIPTGSTGDNNIVDQPIEDIFIHHTGHAFSYDFDYNLNQGSPGFEAATDGFDIGIYGTLRPFKEGSIPINPHIISKSISTETDADGTIEVEIQVEAQDE